MLPHLGYYLGKKPARAGAVRFQFAKYVDVASIRVPPVFGHVVNEDYGMFGNDRAGDCVECNVAHQIMIDAAATRRSIPRFYETSVLKVYSDWTGYNPAARVDAKGNNPTDGGTDMSDAASRWRTQGFPDATGLMHYSKAYAGLPIGDFDTLIKATYLFGAVSVGVNLQQAQVEQFDAYLPWRHDVNSPIIGGHCITACGMNSRGMLVCISWGRTTAVERNVIEQQMDEAIVTFSREYLMATGKSPELYDEATLDLDLASL